MIATFEKVLALNQMSDFLCKPNWRGRVIDRELWDQSILT